MLQRLPAEQRRYLTSAETIELARIQKDNSVIGYALLTVDGEEIEASGAWASMIGPVFANIFALSDQIGEEFGEEDGAPVSFLESPEFEVAAVRLTAAWAVIIKRKQRDILGVLRSVG